MVACAVNVDMRVSHSREAFTKFHLWRRSGLGGEKAVVCEGERIGVSDDRSNEGRGEHMRVMQAGEECLPERAEGNDVILAGHYVAGLTD